MKSSMSPVAYAFDYALLDIQVIVTHQGDGELPLCAARRPLLLICFECSSRRIVHSALRAEPLDTQAIESFLAISLQLADEGSHGAAPDEIWLDHSSATPRLQRIAQESNITIHHISHDSPCYKGVGEHLLGSFQQQLHSLVLNETSSLDAGEREWPLVYLEELQAHWSAFLAHFQNSATLHVTTQSEGDQGGSISPIHQEAFKESEDDL